MFGFCTRFAIGSKQFNTDLWSSVRRIVFDNGGFELAFKALLSILKC